MGIGFQSGLKSRDVFEEADDYYNEEEGYEEEEEEIDTTDLEESIEDLRASLESFFECLICTIKQGKPKKEEC